MVSLADIVPQTRTVNLSVGELELHNLGIRDIAKLLLRHPELQGAYVGGTLSVDLDTLLTVAPDAIGSIIAQSARQPDAADKIADAMNLDDLAECLIGIRDISMPNGVVPFLEKLGRFMGGADVLDGRASVTTTLPPPSN